MVKPAELNCLYQVLVVTEKNTCEHESQSFLDIWIYWIKQKRQAFDGKILNPNC